ncbi:MAG: sigma factor-like helix-turn-helix DNA-binding protein, partial [bacterium]|nr:sigma factor-like helix-turn-helix DNA-binding protein [bacterium]
LSLFVDRDLATLKIEASSSFEILTLPTMESETAHYVDVISIIKNAVTKRQWMVLEMRYLQGMTLEEVAMKLGNKSRECTRLIQEKALRRIRSHQHILHSLLGEEDVELNVLLGAKVVRSLSQRALSAPNSPNS